MLTRSIIWSVASKASRQDRLYPRLTNHLHLLMRTSALIWSRNLPGKRRRVFRAATTSIGEKDSGTSFLAVIGPSGSGKSSVVRAGLIPALRQGALPGSGAWQIVIMTPTERPLEELAARLALLTEPASRARRMRQLQDDLRADKRTLHTEARMERIMPHRRVYSSSSISSKNCSRSAG